jgi:GTPase SAR1 family protein
VIKEQSYLLKVKDMAGAEVYHPLYEEYSRDYEYFFLVYNICSKASFRYLATLRKLVHENTHVGKVSVVIVGTNSDRDKDRQVTTEQGSNFAESNNDGFVEISAKDGTNVKEAFRKIVRRQRYLEEVSKSRCQATSSLWTRPRGMKNRAKFFLLLASRSVSGKKR